MKTVGVYNPQWRCNALVEQSLYRRMTRNGYKASHTGGGCMAWRKELDGGYLMITLDGGLGNYVEEETAVRYVFTSRSTDWVAGRYLDSGDGWVVWKRTGTLAEALKVADRLPAPVEGHGAEVE